MNGFIKTVILSFTVISIFSACSDKMEISGPVSNSPEDQQKYLAKVSKEFTDQMNITELYSSINEIKELLSFIPAYYCQLDNSVFISKYSRAYLDGLLSRQHKTNYTDSILENDTIFLINREIYKEFYKLSNVKGSFYADLENERWVYNESSNLELCYPDSAGNSCILSIKTSGQKTQAYTLQYKNDPILADSSYSLDKKTIICNDTTVLVYIDIPENIEISLTKNKKTIFEFNIKTDLKELDVPLNIDNCSFIIDTEFITDNTDIRNYISYNRENTNIIFSIKKSGNEIIKFNLNSDIRLEGEGLIITPVKDVNFNNFEIKEFYIKPKKFEELSEVNVDKIDFILTLMNQVDIKVKMKNSASVVENINLIKNTAISENSAEYYTIESRMDSIVKETGKNIEEISINFKKSNIEKINLALSVRNTKYINDFMEYISFKPSYIIKFSDGTEQSFYQYFNVSLFSHAFQFFNQLKNLF